MADNAGLVHQSSSLFDWPDTPVTSILQLQTSPSAPLPVDLSTTTGLLAPDVPTVTRLSHFPEDLYDLTDGSHLVRFLKTLLGDAGAGQLRKRQLVARLQTLLNSTHFYDLDAFYGALFGVNRGVTGALPINPYTDVATPDGWDEISTIDAQFREKLLRLARAITMGGTPMGLQAMAEALTGVDCDIYEVYALMDAQGTSGGGNTWNDLEGDFATWDATAGELWSDMEGRQTFGNMGIDCRNEVVVRPKKVYDNTLESLVERADDTRGILRVLDVLKPASALLSVDSNGVGVHAEATIGSISSPSNFWEISARVIPKEELKSWYNQVYKAYDHRANPQGIDSAQPQPPFTNTQGQQYSQVTQVTKATAQMTTMILTKASSFDNKSLVLNKVDYDIVHFPDGKTQTYLPSYALIDPKKASAARTASDGVMIAAPYSGTRNPVPTAG